VRHRDHPVAKMRERYRNRIPCDASVISPAAMFESSLFVTVEVR